MAWKLYVTPIVLLNRGTSQSRLPKFVVSQGANNTLILNCTNYVYVDYGYQPTCLVAADVTAAQDNAIAGQPEAIPVPDDLNGQVGGNPQLSAIRNKLAANLTPETWVVATTTYREIVRLISAISIMLLQFAIIRGDPSQPFAGLTLDSSWSALSAQVQADMAQAARNMGYDDSGLNGTVRSALYSIGSQGFSTSRQIGGITI